MRRLDAAAPTEPVEPRIATTGCERSRYSQASRTFCRATKAVKAFPFVSVTPGGSEARSDWPPRVAGAVRPAKPTTGAPRSAAISTARATSSGPSPYMTSSGRRGIMMRSPVTGVDRKLIVLSTTGGARRTWSCQCSATAPLLRIAAVTFHLSRSRRDRRCAMNANHGAGRLCSAGAIRPLPFRCVTAG